MNGETNRVLAFSSWTNSLAFCALLHSLDHKLVPFHSLDKNNKKNNFLLAFNAAKSIGIQSTLVSAGLSPDFRRFNLSFYRISTLSLSLSLPLWPTERRGPDKRGTAGLVEHHGLRLVDLQPLRKQGPLSFRLSSTGFDPILPPLFHLHAFFGRRRKRVHRCKFTCKLDSPFRWFFENRCFIWTTASSVQTLRLHRCQSTRPPIKFS